jgi:hypothetical protein
VHFEPIDCLTRFGKRWRGEASEALVALGLEPPRLDGGSAMTEVDHLPRLSPGVTAGGARPVNNAGNPGGSPEAARKALNKDTILEMHRAFKLGGRKAIEEVMRNQPAVFLKLLVLLVPREMPVEHTGGVKAMTEDQIVDAIAAIEGYLARRSGEAAKVIEGTAEPAALPAPARKTKRKLKRTLDVVPKGVDPVSE